MFSEDCASNIRRNIRIFDAGDVSANQAEIFKTVGDIGELLTGQYEKRACR
jgi:hypothetical protein